MLLEMSKSDVRQKREKIDFEAECVLPERLQKLAERFEPNPSSSSVVFLTGASGFLGVFILQMLLSKSSSEVICLIRASSDEAAFARIAESWKFFIGSEVPRDFQLRIRAVCGDCESFDVSKSFGKPVESVIHCAAFVSGGRHASFVLRGFFLTFSRVFPYAVLRESNVVGSLKMLEFALLAGAKFKFVSSMSSIGSRLSGYGMTKKVTECHVESAVRLSRGKFQGSIVRPGMIGMSVQSGALRCVRERTICILKKGFLLKKSRRYDLQVSHCSFPIEMRANRS